MVSTRRGERQQQVSIPRLLKLGTLGRVKRVHSIRSGRECGCRYRVPGVRKTEVGSQLVAGECGCECCTSVMILEDWVNFCTQRASRPCQHSHMVAGVGSLLCRGIRRVSLPNRLNSGFYHSCSPRSTVACSTMADGGKTEEVADTRTKIYFAASIRGMFMGCSFSPARTCSNILCSSRWASGHRVVPELDQALPEQGERAHRAHRQAQHRGHGRGRDCGSLSEGRSRTSSMIVILRFVQTGVTEEYIYNRDMDWLRTAECVVAEVTQPSLGVGYELGFAESINVPVLCLYVPLCHA